MKYHEKKKLLTASGFSFLRTARHGSIFIDEDGNRIMLPRPGSKDPRADRNFAAELSRLICRRSLVDTKNLKKQLHESGVVQRS